MITDVALFSVVRFESVAEPLLVTKVLTGFVQYEALDGRIGLASKAALILLRQPEPLLGKIKRSP